MVASRFSLVNARLGQRTLIWGILLTLLAATLAFIPLFDVLGYDFAFALGLLTAFAAVDIGHGVTRGRADQAAPLSLFGRPIALVLLVLLPPLGLSLLNAWRVRNCNLVAGLAFFALLPVGTALVGAPVGVMAGLVAPRRGRWLAWAVPLFSLLWTLGRLYRDPAVFAFDPFGGYFPGPIYDEALRPPVRLLLFRLANLIWVGTGVALLATWQRRRPTVGALAGLLTCLSIALFWNEGRLGFHLTGADLRQILRQETTSPHFRLHADPAAGTSPADTTLVLRDLEFRHHQLIDILGVSPAGPIDVYQFPSGAAKKDLVGAGGTLYAKPWRREIFVQIDRFPASRLRHELAHIFAASFGDPLFGVALSWRLPFPCLASGLVEGLAEAADFTDPEGPMTLHQEARAIIADGRAPPLAQVVGAGFSALSGARAYTLAGSFCRFLLDTRGIAKLRDLYRTAGDFEAVYGTSLATLEGGWRAFLETQPLALQDRARAREQFRRPAIFQKVCARDLAARVAEARAALFDAPDRAVLLLQSVCTDDPADPGLGLDLAEALANAGRAEAASSMARALAQRPDLTAPLQLRAANLRAVIALRAGKIRDAQQALDEAIGFATEEGELRTALARRRALADPDSAQTLGRALFGDSPTRALDGGLVVHLMDRFAQDHPKEALGPYLVARQLSYRDVALALGQLNLACPVSGNHPSGIALPPPFLKECYRLTGELALRTEKFPLTRQALSRLGGLVSSEADRLRLGDLAERVTWEESSTHPL